VDAERRPDAALSAPVSAERAPDTAGSAIPLNWPVPRRQPGAVSRQQRPRDRGIWTTGPGTTGSGTVRPGHARRSGTAGPGNGSTEPDWRPRRGWSGRARSRTDRPGHVRVHTGRPGHVRVRTNRYGHARPRADRSGDERSGVRSRSGRTWATRWRSRVRRQCGRGALPRPATAAEPIAPGGVGAAPWARTALRPAAA
jgi:hypothetical protein